MSVEHLSTLWHERFPLARAMNLSARRFDGTRLETHAPLEGNTNIHDTAFAGSLYAMQAMTCWGLLYLAIRAEGLDASIIHADGQIQFARTLTTDMIASSQCEDLADYMAQLKQEGRIRLTLSAHVSAEGEAQSASTFSGTYLARLT